jgi:putative SOS response-associated peptidase YedK
VSPSSPTFGGGKPVINARIETVASNGLFRGAFASRRCLVPATGYYEWQLQAGGKQPYFVHEPDADLAMAGVVGAWPDRTKPPNDPNRWKLSVAVITRDAHVAPGEVHDRMPACLSQDAYDDWLGDHLGTDELLKLLDRESLQVAHQLTYFAVSKAVNSVKNNGPELIEAL